MHYFSNKLAYIVIWLGVIVSILFIISKEEDNFEKNLTLLEKNLYQEAQAHFNNMVIARSWNASHGGVYVKPKKGLKPNPYLKDNVLIYDQNKTLIKINPAWMTRQISEISNKQSRYFYNLTSNNPLNPSNKPDAFEKEALEFFEKNTTQSTFSKIENINGKTTRYNFMGKLIVKQSCMSCHASQGYKVGDVRGGIRVSLPTDFFNSSVNNFKKDLFYNKLISILFIILIGIVLTLYVRKQNIYNLTLVNLNEEMRKNTINEEAMIVQSRHAAMGEMISMLAHQWRQPISIIEMSVNNIIIDIELGDMNEDIISSELKDISVHTQKLSQTITNFSNHFKSNLEPVDTNLKDLLDELLDIISSSLESNNVKVEIDPSINHTVCLHKEKLLQVYLTIFSNSKEIFIERDIDTRVIYVSVEETSEYIITKICDTGGGIEVNPIEKVLEPYFSTKDASEETGLGLYMAKIIVEKQLNGKLTLQNGTDGACFSIWVPK